MKEIIKNMKDNEICFHIHSQKLGRAWGATTPSHLLSIINKNIGAYEVVCKYPHKHFLILIV